ncbi:hypothetical protein VPH35_014200 [Triticum aestivum]
MYAEVAVMDDEYVRHMELMMERSLWDHVPAPPSPPPVRVKKDLASPPLSRMKAKPASHPRNPRRPNRVPREGEAIVFSAARLARQGREGGGGAAGDCKGA